MTSGPGRFPRAEGPVARRDGSGRPAFSVRVAEEDGQIVLRAAGDLDFTTAALLADALAAVRTGPGQVLAVDVSRLGFIDVGSIRLLAAADQRLGGAGRLDCADGRTAG